MDSRSPDPTRDGTRAIRRIVDGLASRLERAMGLTAEVRAHLTAGDASAIEDRTSQLETLLVEYRLLIQEFHALPVADDIKRREAAALSDRVAGLARSSAVTGRFLEVLVGITRRLVDRFAAPGAESYRATGRSADTSPRGLRLRETV